MVSETNPDQRMTSSVDHELRLNESASTIQFSGRGIVRGFIVGIPIALAISTFGFAFGVLARQAGLSLAETVLMAATVIAGIAEIIAIELWDSPVPIVTILVTTLIVNLRYVLMSAALRPWYERFSPLKTYSSVLFISDEAWALTMRELQHGDQEAGYLLGIGLAIHLFWIASTALGASVGSIIQDPVAWGFDFALTAVLIALLASFWDGESDLVPWLITAVGAVIAAQLLPGVWHIIVGGLLGSSLEVIQYGN